MSGRAQGARARRLAPGGRWRAALGYGAGLAGGAIAWQLLGAHSSSLVIVPLSATLARVGQLIADGSLPGALAASFAVYPAGVALAIAAGAAGGLLLARRALVRQALQPYLIALYAAPMVALIPFLLALLGYGFLVGPHLRPDRRPERLRRRGPAGLRLALRAG